MHSLIALHSSKDNLSMKQPHDSRDSTWIEHGHSGTVVQIRKVRSDDRRIPTRVECNVRNTRGLGSFQRSRRWHQRQAVHVTIEVGSGRLRYDVGPISFDKLDLISGLTLVIWHLGFHNRENLHMTDRTTTVIAAPPLPTPLLESGIGLELGARATVRA